MLETLLIAPLITLSAVLGLQVIAYELVCWWCYIFTLVHGVRHTITGVENLPRQGSYLIAANHCSHFDGPTLILALPHRF